MKDLCFFRRQLGGSAGGVEIRGSWSRSRVLGSELDREVIEHGLNVVFHVDANLSTVAEVKVHCKTVMEIPTGLFCFAAMAMLRVEPGSKIVVCHSHKRSGLP